MRMATGRRLCRRLRQPLEARLAHKGDEIQERGHHFDSNLNDVQRNEIYRVNRKTRLASSVRAPRIPEFSITLSEASRILILFLLMSHQRKDSDSMAGYQVKEGTPLEEDD